MKREDIYRAYVDRAFSSVEPLLNYQTKFLHVHPDLYKGRDVQGILTYENFLFALLLFRKKSVEHIVQGKDLLRRLLNFQIQKEENEGNFPFFITEYPVCRDYFLPFRLLTLFSILLDEFAAVLGKELFFLLKRSREKVLFAASQIESCLSLPSWVTLLLAIEKEEYEQVDLFLSSKEWMNPAILGLVLAALSRKGIFLPCDSFWLHQKYCGPSYGVFQFGSSQQVTLFECIMSLRTQQMLDVIEWPYITSLELSLLSPQHMAAPERSFHFGGEGWESFSMKNITASCCYFSPRQNNRKGFYSCRVVMPEATLVLQLPDGRILSMEKVGSTLVGKCEVWGKEIIMRAFVERHVKIIERSTVFDPYKGIEIGTVRLSLENFSCDLLGHCILGNRAGQVFSEQDAFDWLICFEHLRGEIPKEIQFCIEIL